MNNQTLTVKEIARIALEKGSQMPWQEKNIYKEALEQIAVEAEMRSLKDYDS